MLILNNQRSIAEVTTTVRRRSCFRILPVPIIQGPSWPWLELLRLLEAVILIERLIWVEWRRLTETLIWVERWRLLERLVWIERR